MDLLFKVFPLPNNWNYEMEVHTSCIHIIISLEPYPDGSLTSLEGKGLGGKIEHQHDSGVALTYSA